MSACLTRAYPPGASRAGEGSSAMSAFLTRAANTVSATANPGSAAVNSTGAAFSASRVSQNHNHGGVVMSQCFFSPFLARL